MKKLLLLFLLVAGGVSMASAWSDMYLVNNLTGWENAGYQFTGSNDGSQDVYELTLTSDIVALADGGDIYFRPNHYSEHGQRNPSDGNDFTFTFSDNGQYQTYGPTGKGTGGAFVIPHSTIKANSYKITVYYKYNDGNKFYVKVEIVDMPVSVTDASGYATFVSPYALNFKSSDINAYTADVNELTGQVTLTNVDKVPANTPVVLYNEDGAIDDNIPVIDKSSADAIGTNDLRAGAGSAVSTSEVISGTTYYNYILNKVDGIGFYKAAGMTVDTNRAYLHTNYNVAAGSSSRMTIVFADETTGIKSIDNGQLVMDNYYDLQGRRVAQPTKGLYIVNGKKVIK